MAKSKKPRKAYKPKPTAFKNPVTLWHKIHAKTDQPIPITDRIRIVQGTNAALANVRTGTASIDDWQTILDCINMTETVVLFMKLANDNHGLLREASVAVLNAHKRLRAKGTAILTGLELSAVSAVVGSYQQVLDQLSERAMLEAEYITCERYKLLAQGKKFTRIFEESKAPEPA